MGIKSLTLQMIPWCFHVAGAACRDGPTTGPTRTIRLIGSDGRVRIYDRSVSAAELMHEHPLHLVCRSDTFFIGQRVPALAAGDRLQPGHSYLLLPASFFHSVLSFVTLASSLAGPNPNRKAPIRPFDIKKTDSGTLQVRVSDEFLEKVAEEEEEERRVRRVCTTEELEKDYKQLVRCKSRQWRPKLETIRESERRRGVRALKGFGGIKRRKKKTIKTKDNTVPPPPPSSSSFEL
ncbi:hypothetical protein DsansV1_C27g0199171 [Dioscorea sansibarensis]